jgi:hypothetical protein
MTLEVSIPEYSDSASLIHTMCSDPFIELCVAILLFILCAAILLFNCVVILLFILCVANLLFVLCAATFLFILCALIFLFHTLRIDFLHLLIVNVLALNLYLLSNPYSLLFASLLVFIWVLGTQGSDMHGRE